MTVRKSINLTGSAPTIEAAVHEAVDRASTTLEGITRFEVTKISGDLTETGPIFEVELDRLVHAPGADARVSHPA
jgi:flavin-binding protein dodecin